MALDINSGDAVIYGAYSIADADFGFTGYAQEGDITVTPIAESVEDVVDGVTVTERYTNPGLEISGDFVVVSGDPKLLYVGKVVAITFPGEQTARKFVIQGSPVKYTTTSGKIIVSLSARHRYAMAAAYDTGPIDPATGAAYTGLFKITGFINEPGGDPVSGVVVSDGTRSGTTDANGFYTIDAVPAGTYTITPTKENYSFSPSIREEVNVVDQSLIGKNFVATAD